MAIFYSQPVFFFFDGISQIEYKLNYKLNMILWFLG